jgi:thioredoxin-like negative regulator of GroEL
VNVDDSPGAAEAFGVSGIPTLALFADGREISRQTGLVRLEPLIDWIRTEIAYRDRDSKEAVHGAA